jgi:hypothetical protein
MMNIIPFHKEHLQEMVDRGVVEYVPKEFVDYVFTVIEDQHLSYSAVADGKVVACAGLTELSPARALAWSYLANDIGASSMLRVTRACERMLQLSHFRRVEMDVLYDFEEGHRWAKLLGFELECPRRRAYGPDGRDYALYSRVKP